MFRSLNHVGLILVDGAALFHTLIILKLGSCQRSAGLSVSRLLKEKITGAFFFF